MRELVVGPFDLLVHTDKVMPPDAAAFVSHVKNDRGEVETRIVVVKNIGPAVARTVKPRLPRCDVDCDEKHEHR